MSGDGSGDKKVMSPYFLSASDNPGNIITQVQLKGENYDEWARAIRTALRAKKKYGFIDGAIKQPAEDSSDMEDWWTVNSMLVSWMLNTIEPSLRSTISYMEIAKDLWDDIKERFSVGNGPRIHQLKTELVECKQQGMAIVNYYGRLKMIWEELANYEQNPVCRCGNCNCNITAELDKKREEERLHQFLMGLDDSIYGTIRSNILSNEPLPNLNRAYAMVIQEERVRNITRGKEQRSEHMAFAVQTGSTSKGRTENKDKPTVCTNCNKPGHNAETCFKLVGYPDWWGDRPKGSRRRVQGGSKQSTNPAGRGRGGLIRANAACTPGQGNDTTDAEKGGLSGLSGEQWNMLISLLNAQKDGNQGRLNGTYNTTKWIIDSGASHHMTGSLDLMNTMKDTNSAPVGLPDGKEIMVQKEGDVELNKHLKLNKVLYVPDLKCNLISISQLTKEMNCTVLFTNKFCVIQDHNSRMLIGMGEKHEGLYYFKQIRGMKCALALKKVRNDSFGIWHQRLGHPSNKIVGLLPIVDVGSDKCDSCEVCFRAKHIRGEFLSSNNKASSIFEMIHCDLWGPYKTPTFCGAHYFLTIVDDFSRSVWVYLLQNKSEVGQSLRNFFALIQRQFNGNVKIVRSDNGTEFTCLHEYFTENGVIHQTSCVGTPQQNGRVERKHRHILNVARALRFQANLPIDFWGECVLTAAYLINRTPSMVLKGKTPYELLYGQAPSYGNIRVFGCLAYAHNQRREGDKFASRSRKCVFAGYPFGKKGWTMYDVETGDLFVSRDVIFVENQFPYTQISDDKPKMTNNTNNDILTEEELDLFEKMPEQKSDDKADQEVIEFNNGQDQGMTTVRGVRLKVKQVKSCNPQRLLPVKQVTSCNQQRHLAADTGENVTMFC